MDINEFWNGLRLRFNLKELPQELHPEGKGFEYIHCANLESGILVEKRSGGHTWRFQKVDSSYNVIKYLDVNSDILVLNLEAYFRKITLFLYDGKRSDLEKSYLPILHKAWEYKIFRERKLNLDTALNDLGKEGWEMVTAVKDDNGWLQFIFKREKIEGV